MITYQSPARKVDIRLLVAGLSVALVGLIGAGWFTLHDDQPVPTTTQTAFVVEEPVSTPLPTSPPTPVTSPSPSPTPQPLSFADMNEQYGPCISVPVLLYHHIQPEAQAKERNQTSLTVYTPLFREQMEYLKEKGYTTIEPKDLINFFESGQTLPTKPVLITVDDGYENNYTDMFPILKELNLKATIFLASGLMENPGYLRWEQIAEMANQDIYFGNHTWSHKNMQSNRETIALEIGTAASQLLSRGLDADKVFAFPYGLESIAAMDYLKSENYGLAFDTTPGRIQCAKKKYALPRIRVGNTRLSAYGL